jgi:butyrate kinase
VSCYYRQEGRCIAGAVKVQGKWIKRKLNFKCCAKKCGAHVSFVGVTQAVCKAHFRKAISYGANQCGKVVRSSDNARDHRDPMVCTFWAN